MSRKMTAYLGLGANLGDRLEQLKQAVELLNHTKGICVKRISSVYETSPVGFLEQPDFYNLVIEIQTTLTPAELLRHALKIEKKLHRIREVRWGPRTMDIDLLLYDERIIEQEKLTVPHPRMTERAFVLIPLREIAGNLRIPGTDATLDELIARLSKEQLVRKLEIPFEPIPSRHLLI
jgi:2-amino-4-hydroxy-6-hydroxymethyldihydropteridine diphosphokinase